MKIFSIALIGTLHGGTIVCEKTLYSNRKIVLKSVIPLRAPWTPLLKCNDIKPGTTIFKNGRPLIASKTIVIAKDMNSALTNRIVLKGKLRPPVVLPLKCVTAKRLVKKQSVKNNRKTRHTFLHRFPTTNEKLFRT